MECSRSSLLSSGGGTGWASMANHQRTQSLPLATSLSHAHPASTSSHTPATIINTPLTDHHSYPSAAKKSQGNVGGGKCSFRERCDSMPSRPRTTSEGTHALAFRNAFRETSHSPPGETLTSPPSESTGSSHSVSEDHEMDHQRILSVLTPDEVIAEEDVSDSSGRSHRMMEISNDYLDMSSGINAPQGDYLDMTRGGSLLKHASNSASTSSVTSGTHSNDIRYRDYPLDKVQSYVSTEDDDTRPCRAYSVGSKPTDTGISSGISQNPRLRAYSVGSKAKKHFNRVLQPHLHIPGIKSNSAPLLAPNPRLGSSHGSMSDSMAHLMEIDFSINEKNQKKSKIYAFLEHIGVMTPNDQKRSMPVTSTPDGYVDMNKPMMSQQQQRSLSGGDSSGAYVDMTQGQRLIAQLEMATGLGSVPLVGHPYSPYMDMSSTNNYMDMSGSSPAKVASEEYNRQFHHHQQSSDYADMTVTRQRTNSNSSMNSRTATSPGSLCSQMSSSPHYGGVSPRISEHVPFEVHPIIRDTGTRNAEEYVEMTPGNTASIISHPRQNSTDSAENEYGDYLNMSDKINKNRSQPIDIQTISGNTVANNSSPLTTNSLLGRKFSPTGVITPRMHLPLMTYSSLPRQKNTRNSSQQDTSSGSSNTTPSSSSTMFPMSLNSPLSPNNRSSTAGTPGSMKIPPSVLNVPYKSTTRKVNEDYIMMDCSESKCSPLEGSQAEEESPYMNYCPPGVQSRLQSSDYDIIKPGGSFVGKSSTLPRTKNSSCLASPLSNHLSSVGLNDNRQNNMCFMPIREKDERMPSPKPGDVPDRLALENRTLETASMDCDDVARPYERLKSPFGISSLKTSTKSNSDCSQTRPSSTTGSEKNLSRPSSVCSEGLASRLGSSSSVYSSSSSTSTVINAKSVDQNETEQNVCLHYASLDLTDAGEEKRSPRASSETNLNENPPSTTFVYADIDFIRSDELNSRGSEPGQQPGSSVNAVN
ncbi:hypothetical protein ABEB36_009974 [Hypothenemus hampei]|uniref:Insulin receptor substrate 1 n=1 Tax=Hypothenemus hampei TaxID=57062 RepID=A0ABD1EI50_HYPHA